MPGIGPCKFFPKGWFEMNRAYSSLEIPLCRSGFRGEGLCRVSSNIVTAGSIGIPNTKKKIIFLKKNFLKFFFKLKIFSLIFFFEIFFLKFFFTSFYAWEKKVFQKQMNWLAFFKFTGVFCGSCDTELRIKL